MSSPQKKGTRFDECASFDEGKKLYRKELIRCHPDQGGSDEELILLKKEFDRWVSKKAWEARQQGANFRQGGGPGGHGPRPSGFTRSTDPEEFLSDKTKQVLREIIESGLNVSIEIVGSFIWLDGVSPGDILTLIAWGFTHSKKYGGRWFWADFDHLKKTGKLPRGKFSGSFDDMKRIHRNKVAREKQYLGYAPQEQEEQEEA